MTASTSPPESTVSMISPCPARKDSNPKVVRRMFCAAARSAIADCLRPNVLYLFQAGHKTAFPELGHAKVAEVGFIRLRLKEGEKRPARPSPHRDRGDGGAGGALHLHRLHDQ